MIEVFQFIFSSFWTFLGTAVLMGIVTDCLIKIVALVAIGRKID